VRRNVAASTQNVAFNVIFFHYRNVLDIDVKGIDNVARAKRPMPRFGESRDEGIADFH
jgi:hypothetical protein